MGSPVNITGITQANPAVVTATGHGFSNGDVVWIDGVGGMAEVFQYYKVANVTTDTFSLQTLADADVDSTGFTAYTSGGKVTEQAVGVGIDISTSPAAGYGNRLMTRTKVFSQASDSGNLTIPIVFCPHASTTNAAQNPFSYLIDILVVGRNTRTRRSFRFITGSINYSTQVSDLTDEHPPLGSSGQFYVVGVSNFSAGDITRVMAEGASTSVIALGRNTFGNGRRMNHTFTIDVTDVASASNFPREVWVEITGDMVNREILEL